MPRRPLVFVVHSLGGIVCKKAIAWSFYSAQDKLTNVAGSLVGIVFMGTPHRGSGLANIFSPLVSGIGFFKSTGTLIKTLKRDKQTATDLDREFWDAIKKMQLGQEVQIFFFFLRADRYL